MKHFFAVAVVALVSIGTVYGQGANPPAEQNPDRSGQGNISCQLFSVDRNANKLVVVRGFQGAGAQGNQGQTQGQEGAGKQYTIRVPDNCNIHWQDGGDKLGMAELQKMNRENIQVPMTVYADEDFIKAADNNPSTPITATEIELKGKASDYQRQRNRSQ